MKIYRIFTIAAAALMMAACSTDDIAQLFNGGKKNFTATLAAPGSGGTRTILKEDNNKITVKWAEGDEIALVHNGVKDVATVKSVDATTGKATITGTLTGTVNNNDPVKLIYPAAYVSGVSDGDPIYDDSKLLTQGGTLDYIQKNLDFRKGSGTFSDNGSEVTLNSAVKLESDIAIWKLTLSDGTNNLSATQVKIKGGESVLASTTTLTAGTSEVTLAMPTNLSVVGALTIEATVDEDTYTYTKADGVTFTANTYYQNEVMMEKPWDGNLATVTKNVTATDGTTIYGTLGKNVKISIADGATVTLDGVTINGENDESYKWAGITCEGDATIILKDGTTNTVNGFHQNYPGIYVPGDAENPANNKTLTIKGETAGTGSLTAICQDINGFAAGIGGNNEESCGNIVIAGGTINATGGCGAGIGSGPTRSCGAITISGGTVTATGGNRGAGIGSGDYGTCGAITISGGTVKATGGAYGAGIGSGQGEGNQSSTGKCGDITIYGGSVTATGGFLGAGIGSGCEGNCGNILISGGTVSATGGQYAAAIGSGDEGSCGNITITTGVTQVTATRDGGLETVGRGGNGYCGTVTIGCTLDNSGNPVGGKTGTISTSPFVYPAPQAGDVTPLDPFEGGGGDPLNPVITD